MRTVFLVYAGLSAAVVIGSLLFAISGFAGAPLDGIRLAVQFCVAWLLLKPESRA